MNAVAWIVLGGVIALLALVSYVGWRVDQAARSLVAIGQIVQRAADKEPGRG